MNIDRYYSKIRLQKGRYAIVVAFLLVVLAIVVFWSTASKDQPVDEEKEAQTVSLDIKGPVLPESNPVSISIPAINLETTFVSPLGLEESGEVEVPDSYEKVGWYKYGPTPGEAGPAVVLGHVDSVDGPAIFWSLGQLSQGDDIYIVREDGKAAIFEVVSLERTEQSDFPTQDVYGDIDHAGLRLITCSGTYEKDKLRYTHSLIVYAKLKDN